MSGLTKVRADIFPARLVKGSMVIDPCKVLIGLDRMWVCRVQGRDGEILHEWPLDDIRGSLQHGYVATVGGVEVTVDRSGNCGCGVNKSWKPFNYQLVMSRMPSR